MCAEKFLNLVAIGPVLHTFQAMKEFGEGDMGSAVKDVCSLMKKSERVELARTMKRQWFEALMRGVTVDNPDEDTFLDEFKRAVESELKTNQAEAFDEVEVVAKAKTIKDVVKALALHKSTDFNSKSFFKRHKTLVELAKKIQGPSSAGDANVSQTFIRRGNALLQQFQRPLKTSTVMKGKTKVSSKTKKYLISYLK